MESTLGWRFDFWLVVILAGVVTIVAFFTMPETVSETVSKKLLPSFHLKYAPVLLQRRAKALEHETNYQRHFISKHDLARTTSLSTVLTNGLRRPFSESLCVKLRQSNH